MFLTSHVVITAHPVTAIVIVATTGSALLVSLSTAGTLAFAVFVRTLLETLLAVSFARVVIHHAAPLAVPVGALA